MAARAETLAVAHELMHPVVVPVGDEIEEALRISSGKYDMPVARYDIPKHSQDITPETLLHKDERYLLHVSRDGDGLIQVIHPINDNQGDIFVPRDKVGILQEEVSDDFQEDDGKRYVKIYGVIDLAK